MAGLQRSSISFRRQGSSGLVWEDRFLSGELDQMKQKEEGEQEGAEVRELTKSKSVGSAGIMERSRSNGGRGYRTGKVSPAIDPPSPKVSACGFCDAFKKPKSTRRPKSGKRKS
ncbi:PREDICTED: uncharacterized protein At1g15400 [Nelumbo nucifera]|uniref:MAPK kinase substrate protein At1g80180-like n=2 Tax=Nelumbo nucifera TaxID=4432 RepID=A0A822ZJJ2_NELNU|nr:PREDICTED: uncharacterized protein At1g15400 [Nelumbo nucifera]DAD44863.1 TPA_asm: hypothetical protein HUJ06_003093 [Nelumbo nucifera]